ncbi:MAG TPA: hypothetical protein DET40_20730 [Lentisphaeria bacterium]|nr:MAG: hypothetical protein A2X45_00565 [Lentisphaerae bacterium GWF2_50_93]HCE45978.1 hypothetical protein [Lentisphaeria bacterium]
MSKKLNPNHRKQSSSGMSILKALAGLLLVPAILIMVAVAGIQYYKSSYRNEQRLLSKELSEIKVMSDEEIRLEAAKSAKLEHPVKPPSKTQDQVSKEAMDAARKMTDLKFNPRNLAEQITDALKSYNEARPGQQVEFMTRTKADVVRGTYKGKDGVFVLIDTGKYSIRDIQEEYKYLFDPGAADFMAQEKVKSLKSGFKSESEKYLEENRKRLEEELYASSGYVKLENGAWRARSDIFEEAYAALKQQKENSRKEEMQRAVQKHRLFGFISVEPEINK